jgi:hypothetical protein
MESPDAFHRHRGKLQEMASDRAGRERLGHAVVRQYTLGPHHAVRTRAPHSSSVSIHCGQVPRSRSWFVGKIQAELPIVNLDAIHARTRQLCRPIESRLIAGQPKAQSLKDRMGCGSGMTCWRRLRDWQEAGTWQFIHFVVLDWLARCGQIEWSRAVVDSCSVRAVFGGRGQVLIPPTGPSRAASVT